MGSLRSSYSCCFGTDPRLTRFSSRSAHWPPHDGIGERDVSICATTLQVVDLQVLDSQRDRLAHRHRGRSDITLSGDRPRPSGGYKLLIIDELGFVPLSKTGAELLFELISQRYERGATPITSNLPFDEWTETFGTERLTGALLDRLTHHVSILEMNGESYRLAQSRARKVG